MWKSRRSSYFLFIGVLIIGLGGCRGPDEIVYYSVAKQAERKQAPSPAAQLGTAPSQNQWSWTTPMGWQPSSGSDMRLATLKKGDAEISITQLPALAGNILDNVNRWRGQVDLGDFDQAGLIAATYPVDGALGTWQRFIIINEAKPDNAIIAAMLPTEKHTLFVKCFGPLAAVRGEEGAVDEIAASLKKAEQ